MVDRREIPAFMDNTYGLFGVDAGIIKSHALRTAHDAFLGDASPPDPFDMDAELPNHGVSFPEACSPSGLFSPLHSELRDLMEPCGGYDALGNDTWASPELSSTAESFMDMFLDTSLCA